MTTSGCGSDENNAGVAAADAAVAETGAVIPPGDDASATAADVTVYTGTTASLDASSSAGSTFAWTVKSVPNGSTITTGALQGAATTHPSFVPDVSGDYVLELAVTSGAASSTKSVTVKAVPAPIFYMLNAIGEKPPYYEVRTVGMDGTGAHAITCRQQITADAGDGGSGDLMGFYMMSMIQADIGVDWWEAPAGQPSRAAFQDFDFKTDGGRWNLAVGTTESTCQNPPKIVHALSNVLPDGGIPQGDKKPAIYQPRFSPDGKRVAYIEQRPEGYYIAVVGYDGDAYRQIAPLCPSGGADCTGGGDVFIPPRPQWIDNQTVAWARNVSGNDAGDGWEILIATDGPLPNPTRYMSCDGWLPLGFAMLKDGSVLANRHPVGQAADLFVLKPATTGGSCQVVRNLTNLPGGRLAYARDFSVSPDGSKVAFVRYVPAADAGDAGFVTNGGEIYVADISGATAPAPLSTPPQQAQFGPRYIAQGAFLSYNGVAPIPADAAVDDAGLAEAGLLDAGLPAIVVVPSGGGAARFAATSDIGTKSLVVGGGNGGGCGFGGFSCSIASPAANVTGGLSALGFAALFLARRRRRD